VTAAHRIATDPSADHWARLRAATPARVGLQRCGNGLATAELLAFQLAHAHARDAVHGAVDFEALAAALQPTHTVLHVQSAAADRPTYLRRPDLGRRLDAASRVRLSARQDTEPYDVAFVICDGLSAAAINDHAVATLQATWARLAGWKIAPVVLAAQARVALGDEVCVLLHARMAVVLIGERPGLTVANSLGIYLTWTPRPGHRDADRNCISNIHADGISYQHAAEKLVWLMSMAQHLQITGVGLKEDAGTHLVMNK
jgi:ethanolamine ammonia-lyase small subunit